jgi:hypothetical protein
MYIISVIIFFFCSQHISVDSWKIANIRKIFTASLVATTILSTPWQSSAVDNKIVGDFPTSGFLFKDTLKISEFSGVILTKAVENF